MKTPYYVVYTIFSGYVRFHVQAEGGYGAYSGSEPYPESDQGSSGKACIYAAMACVAYVQGRGGYIEGYEILNSDSGSVDC